MIDDFEDAIGTRIIMKANSSFSLSKKKRLYLLSRNDPDKKSILIELNFENNDSKTRISNHFRVN